MSKWLNAILEDSIPIDHPVTDYLWIFIYIDPNFNRFFFRFVFLDSFFRMKIEWGNIQLDKRHSIDDELLPNRSLIIGATEWFK